MLATATKIVISTIGDETCSIQHSKDETNKDLEQHNEFSILFTGKTLKKEIFANLTGLSKGLTNVKLIALVGTICGSKYIRPGEAESILKKGNFAVS